MTTDKRWGLVLSGGTAFGIANAGVLEVLEREGLRPDCISGSSMGAIVAALWMTGHNSQDMLRVIEGLSMKDIAAFDGPPWKGSLHAGLLRHRIADHLSHLLGDKTIADCPIPFICVAGRIKKPVEWLRIVREGFSDHLQDCVEPYVFPPETRLLDAVFASSAVPVLFRPVTIGENTFVDLVSFGAIPASHLKERCDPEILIATDTNQQYAGVLPFLPAGWRTFIQEGLKSVETNKALCDLVIAPPLKGNQYRFDKAAEFYAKGKEAAEEMLPRVRELVGGN
jgi:NTE family protein